MTAQPAPSASPATLAAASATAPVSAAIGLSEHRRQLADGEAALAALLAQIDQRRGMVMANDHARLATERTLVAFVDPPLAITGRGDELVVEALSPRGRLLLGPAARALLDCPLLTRVVARPERVRARLRAPAPVVEEADRLRQPTLLAAARALLALLPAHPLLGLYGAIGYDCVRRLEDIPQLRERPADQRDLVLYLPDELLSVGPAGAEVVRFDFTVDGRATRSLPCGTALCPLSPGLAAPAPASEPRHDLEPGGYGRLVAQALARFRSGELFELVLSHTLRARARDAPSALFQRMRAAHQAPYGFYINLGAGEALVGASPERFVRVERRDGALEVSSCPISGTIARGGDACADAEATAALLASAKDHAELTMCTDVDRNDKARICVPGSVMVVARRRVEAHARLLHTVDEVRGTLSPGVDAIDALQAHMWAVTVTGAPKLDAMRAIETMEASARRWYGGAMGRLGSDGACDTGLLLRAARLHHGLAEVRVGATLLHCSDPAAEEAETLLKAAGIMEALAPAAAPVAPPAASAALCAPHAGIRVLLVDHRDSFVHTLADYLRRLGAQVRIRRAPLAQEALLAERPELVVLSPGPGTPQEFRLPELIARCVQARLAVFGVCLGLQGLAVWAGGTLGRLARPRHGEASIVLARPSRVLAGLPPRFRAGRYHSLHALALPPSLALAAEDEDGVVLAAEHRELPLSGVQFHPESILTEPAIGLRILANALAGATRDAR